jgi:hypothetical protein
MIGQNQLRAGLTREKYGQPCKKYGGWSLSSLIVGRLFNRRCTSRVTLLILQGIAHGLERSYSKLR